MVLLFTGKASGSFLPSFPSCPLPYSPIKMTAFKNLKNVLFKNHCKNLYYSDSCKENVQITRNPTVNILRNIMLYLDTQTRTHTHFTLNYITLHMLLWVYVFSFNSMSRVPFPINKNPHHNFNCCGIFPYKHIPLVNSLWLTFRLISNVCSHAQQRWVSLCVWRSLQYISGIAGSNSTHI